MCISEPISLDPAFPNSWLFKSWRYAVVNYYCVLVWVDGLMVVGGLASLLLWNHEPVWQFSSTMKDKFWWGTCTILIISARNWEFAAQPVMFVTAWKSYAFNKKSLPEARNTRENKYLFFFHCVQNCVLGIMKHRYIQRNEVLML